MQNLGGKQSVLWELENSQLDIFSELEQTRQSLKKTLIHFESDVFNAVAVIDAKSGQGLLHTSLAGFDKGNESYENYIEYYVM